MKLDSKFQEKLGEMFAVPVGESALPGALLVDIEKIKVAPQPREYFDETALTDLGNSIRELHAAGKGIGGTGILQPLLVRSAANGEGNGVRDYIVTAGERRLRAAKAAGLKQVPVVIDEISTDEAWEHAIIENLLRADLAPLEEAQALQKLMRSRGYSVREAAKRLGKDKGYLENRLFLLKAPEDVQRMVSARADTIRHAREICKISEVATRKKLIEAALAGASAVGIQARVQNLLEPKEKAGKERAEKELLKQDRGASSAEVPAVELVPAVEPLSAYADSEVFALLAASVQKVRSVVENLPVKLPRYENPTEDNKENIRQQFARELRGQIAQLQELIEIIEENQG